MKLFENEEIESLYCGSMKNEYWDKKELSDNIVATYGYSNKKYIEYLFLISSLSKKANPTSILLKSLMNLVQMKEKTF